MRKTLFMLFLLSAAILPTSMMAAGSYQDKVIDGLSYRLWDDLKATIINSSSYTELKTLNIPSTVVDGNKTYTVDSIGYQAFYINNSKLTDITITNIKYIGKQAFRDCRALTSITIPSSVTAVGEETFMGCTNLKTVTIETGITEIPFQMFWNCSKLEEVTIPNTVTKIGERAFGNCTSLKKLICLATAISEVKDNAFLNVDVTNVKLLHFTSLDVTKEPWVNFDKVNISNLDYLVGDLYYNIVDNTNHTVEVTNDQVNEYNQHTGRPKTKKYTSSSVTIPSSVTINETTYTVVGIGETAFKNHTEITTVQISGNIEYINESAFEGCTGITTITLPATVNTIGIKAFSGCTNLTTVTRTVGTDLLQIHDEAFKNCSSLENAVLPDDLTFLGDGVFEGCISITSATIPSHLTSFGDRTFYQCTGLQSVEIPMNITSIGNWAFKQCYQLKGINIPSSISSIGEEAFMNCKAFKTITIPQGVTSIEAGTFHYCTELTEVHFHEQITIIKNEAFSGCGKLTYLCLPSELTTIGEQAFNGCTSVTALSIPGYVTSIASKAFYDCDSLKNIYCRVGAHGSPVEENFNDDNFNEYTYANATLHYTNDILNLKPWKNFTKKKLDNNGFFKLTIKVDGEVTEEKSMQSGTYIPRKDIPTKGGRAFSGWSGLPLLMPAQDTIVSASFKYLASFKVKDGDSDYQEVANDSIFYGNKVTPPASTKTGNEIIWENLPATMPAEDLVIKGSYALRSYKVVYIIDGVKKDSASVKYQAAITPISVEEKNGYHFAWESYPETMPAENITIHGHYTPQVISNNLTYYLYPGEQKAVVIDYSKKDSTSTVAIPVNVTHTDFPGVSFSVKEIGKEAFRNSKMKNVILPTSLSKIRKEAFRQCQNITTITIPASVDSIAYGAFMYCTALTDIYSKKTDAPVADVSSFDGPNKKDIVVHVPAGSKGNYDKLPWNDMASPIKELVKKNITYLLDGEQYGAITEKDEGDTITIREKPAGERKFSGWSPKLIFMPDSNVTITGSFEYQISYTFDNTDKGSEKYFYGAPITAPEIDAKKGHHVVWNNLPETMPAKDSLVTGQYEPNKYVVTYQVDGKTLAKKDTIDYGSSITPPAVRDSVGYTFAWDTYPTTMPDKDITITGKYNERIVTVTQDGINYRVYLIQKKAEVISGSYTGKITVADKVTFKENDYTVTATVKAIADKAFNGCKSLTGVILSGNISDIGEQAFKDCWELTAITLPVSVTSIDKEAFTYCNKLENIYVKGNAPSLGDNVFQNTPYQTSTVLHATNPDQFKNAPVWKDFFKIEELTTKTLTYTVNGETYQEFDLEEGDDITPLAAPTDPQKPDRVFSGWSDIPAKMPGENVSVTGSFQYAMKFTFEQEDKGTQEYFFGKAITAPEIAAKEGYHATWNNLPQYMPAEDRTVTGQYEPNKYVVTYEVDGEPLAKKDTIDYQGTITPPEVPVIEGKAFAWDTYPAKMPAENITVTGAYSDSIITVAQDGVNYRVNKYQKKAEVISGSYTGAVTIADKVTVGGKNYAVIAIADEAFKNSKKMTGIKLPETIKTIGFQAFRDCQGLTIITLPASIEDIADEAFLYCTKLEHIYCFATSVPTADEKTFQNTNAETTNILHVPAAALSSYKSTSPWSTFKNITDIKKPTLTYYVDGQKYGDQYQITEGEVITPIDDPTKGNRSFSGWQGFPADYKMPDKDLDIKGGFSYLATFNFEGKEVKKTNYNYGDSLKVPVPGQVEGLVEKEGYDIVWENLPVTMPAQDSLITGKYVVKSYEVTFKVDDKEYKKETITYNANIKYPEMAERTGYKFNWDKNAPQKMPAQNTTINGYYTQRVEDTQIDGVNYRVYMVEGRAEVVALPNNALYTGAVTVKGQITYEKVNYDVTYIAPEAFKSCVNMTDITLPANTDSIGKQAFRDCHALTTIMLPASLKKIGEEAFMYCTTLNNVYIYGSKPAIGSNVFFSTPYTTTTTLHVAKGTRDNYVNADTWKDFKTITEITTNNLIYMVDGVMYQTVPLEEGDKIPASPTPSKKTATDAERIFSGWSAIPDKMPDHDVEVTGNFQYEINFKFEDEGTVTTIPKYYFYSQAVEAPEIAEKVGYKVEWTDLPETMGSKDITVAGRYVPCKHVVTYYVDDQVYKDSVYNYGSAIIPPTVENKDGYVFNWNDYPATMPDEDITIKGYYTERIVDVQQGGVTFRVYMLQNRAEVIKNKDNNGFYTGSIVITDKVNFESKKYDVTSIVDKAFEASKQMTDITLPGTLKTIGFQSFRDCQKLTTIILPASVENIGEEAFLYCNKLEHVYGERTVAPTAAENTFKNTPYESTTILHVPTAALSSYKNTTPWSKFKNITDIKKPTLTYVLDGAEYQKLQYTENDAVTMLPDPEKDGRLFSGWTPQITIMPDHDVTITGNFLYTITYELADNTIKPQTYYYGETITVPEVVEKAGHSVVWENLPATMPAKDVTVKGNYVVNKHTVTYYVDNEVYKDSVYTYGATITPPTVEDKAGYVFDWEQYPTTMPDKDIMINGYYTERIVDVQQDGVTYRVYMLQNRAEVIKNKDSNGFYNGSIQIADKVTFEEKEYEVTSIVEKAFEASKKMTDITLPNTLVTIGKQAFRDCQGLKTIDLPASITDIEEEAFRYCTGLTVVVCHCKTLPDADASAFDGINFESATLYVPESMINTYKVTAPWNLFGTIKSIESTDIRVITLMTEKDAKFYNLNGLRVEHLVHGQHYIMVKGDGSRVKFYYK